MRKTIALIIFIAISMILVQAANARSGCCSYHGGVAGCGCADGTPLSSTCAPYYPQCYQQTPVYNPPVPTPEILSVNASLANDYNSQTKQYSVKFDWDDVVYSTGYSVSISKYPGSNPGPLIDTYKSVWRFNHITAGTWYVNLKSQHVYSWSQIIYWKIDLPNAETKTVK